MTYAPQLLLIAAVAGVGVLHTAVPDHWAPITLMARQNHWTRAKTARAAFGAGTGHVLSTLALGLVVWLAGVAVAAKFGHWVEIASSVALILFGGWVAITGWREVRSEEAHAHSHAHHPHGHDHDHEHGHDHEQGHKHSNMALLLILGSSPMVEGLPAFFAAGKYGIGEIVIMSLVFAASTIMTYVLLCVFSLASLENVRLGPVERYGEVISGLFIVAIGVAFWIWPVL